MGDAKDGDEGGDVEEEWCCGVVVVGEREREKGREWKRESLRERV